MRKVYIAFFTGVFLFVLAVTVAGEKEASNQVTATAIEACSCPLFCSCYYNSEPTGGHMCRFNMAFKLSSDSSWNDQDLADVKVWISGDLGSHFGDGTAEWATVSFDRSTTPAQREALKGWMSQVFPVQWGKFETREDDITWQDGQKSAHAKLASGMAEIHLQKVIDEQGKQATVLNTPYWNADSNTGFLLAHSTHHYQGDPSFEFENRNGFMITVTTKDREP